MAATEPTDNAFTQSIRKFAMQYPGVSETGVCVNRAFKAGKKSFLFMGVKADGSYHFRLKLGDSLGEAMKLAKKEPARYEAGKIGWTKISFAAGEKPPTGLIECWTEESFQLLAPKKQLAELPPGGLVPKRMRRRR